MFFHFYTLDQCPATLWKNGGGTTREIACWPQNSTISDFDWRISIADIAMNGPFSAFTGLDRTIMLLNGHGVQLTAKDGSFDHRLATPLVPFHFSGDTALDCILLNGATRDFNVMTRRGVWHADTRIVHHATQHANSKAGLIFVVSGQWDVRLSSHEHNTVSPLTIKAGEGVWWCNHDMDVSLVPTTADASVVMTQFRKNK